MFYYKYHIHMDAPQYVKVDVTLSNVCYWMVYYTHHSDMDALQNVYVHVPSDNPFS
jgi:hypothetical protein